MNRSDNYTLDTSQQDLLNQYEEMKEIALRDSLTGLLNRGALEREIRSRLHDMAEQDTCAIFIIDLDDFKTVNDRLGHQAGDEVLVQAAGFLSKIFRASDIVGRLGGDEFLVFRSGNLSEEMVRKEGQMICDQIQFVLGQDSEISVTVSVGIHMSQGKMEFEELYRMAEKALYRAKNSGKRGYCISKDGTEETDTVKKSDEPINAIRLRFLLDHIESGVALTETESPLRFLYASSAFIRMIGIDREALFGSDMISLIHPDDRMRFLEMPGISEIEPDDEVSEAVRVLSADGGEVWWRIHASRIEYSENKVGILLSVVDISELKEKESSLQMDKNLFQTAMDQTAQGIWEVDRRTKTFRIVSVNDNFPVELKEPNPFPESLIRSQWIHPECADSFRRFAADIFEGKIQGYANFKVRIQGEDTYRWVSFSYRAVPDEAGSTARIAGIIERMYQGHTERISQKIREILPESTLASLIFQMDGSLTQDLVEYCWNEGKEITGEEACRSCTEVLGAEIQNAHVPEMGERFSRSLSRDTLMLEHLEKGRSWMMYEYRRVDKSGQIRWVSCVIYLYQVPEEQDVKLSLWISDMERRHQWEVRYGVNVHKDSITKMYSRSTAEEIISRIIEAKEYKKCALVMVWIGGIDRLYSQYTGNTGMRMRSVMIAMQLAMGDECVWGQLGLERYILFFPDVKDQKILKKKLEQAFAFIRGITSDLVEGSLVRFGAVGICRHRDEADYMEMSQQIHVLSQLRGNITKDRVIFAGEEEEEQDILCANTKLDGIRMIEEGAMRPLSEYEKESAFSCILEMLNTDTLKEAAHCMLRFLGEYYDADRVYILMTIEKGAVVTMTQEWTATHKRSIQQAVTGMKTERMPLISRCAEENRPVFVTKKSEQSLLVQNPKAETEKGDAWKFAVYPIQDAGQTKAFLCIENARNGIMDSAMPMLLGSCLLKEYKKSMHHSGHEAGERVIDDNLPNYKSYVDAVVHYTSDVYSSLGAVTIDVPEYSMINGYQGFAVGRKMLRYVIQAMIDVFGKANLFRTWDSEFVVLCPNTTKKAFYSKCVRLREALMRRYPKEIRMGYTWSGKVFSGKTLVEDARTIMQYSMPEKRHMEKYQLPSAFTGYRTIGEMIRAGIFTIYFQPKINMEDGSLEGAEVLVRGMDREGRVITPIQFLDVFEKNGSVRDLDLHVLDCVMRTVDQWRESGKRLVPLSVNFSSATMSDTHIKASILAVQSRYPELDTGMIELEINDRPDAVIRRQMADTIREIQKYGFTFCMDNFGAKQVDLSALVELPIHSVKLDRTLISDIVESENSRILVQDISDICEKKKICCIAKGVETVEQDRALRKTGCRYAQGFYYARPMPENVFAERYLSQK